jgi:hypothetical protein
MRSAIVAFSLLGAVALPAGAEPDGKPTVVPAVLRSVAPSGIARGGAVTFTLDGARLAGATGVFFDDAAISGRVLPAADPKKPDAVRVQAMVGSQARIGVHRLFVQTPAGATDAVPFAVGGWPETKEVEPNDTPEAAQPISLPATVVGALDKPGDADCYRFEARPGQELVFQVVGASIRSRLNAVLTLMDRTGRVLARANASGSRPEPLLGYRFSAGGIHGIQIQDFGHAGGADVYYRLNIGAFPVVTAAYPLGLRQGSSAEVTLSGFNLGPRRRIRVTAPAAPASWGKTMPLPGPWLTAPRLAIGQDPETAAVDLHDTPGQSQRVPVPVTINGRIGGKAGAPAAAEFRFAARRGQRLVLEVAARRLGSPLDSLIEVLDTRGRPIERATIRPLAETALVLSNRDSGSGSFRLQFLPDLALNDYVWAGRELLQVNHLPSGPDDDVAFRRLRGSRTGLLGTTPEAHSIGTPVYKVQVYPPGRTFAPNGMPLFHVDYRNDDGGPLYGKDSYLTFDPPADGDYLVRITDVRGLQGPEYAYRLSIHPPRPDFHLSMSPEHPNVLRGSSVPVNVDVEQYDGFDGPVEVRLEGLPAGFSAARGVIAPGSDSVTLTLSASAGAATPSPLLSRRIRLVGRASIAGREVVRAVEPENGVRLLTVLPEPDIRVTTDVRNVTLRPGGTVEVVAHVDRRNAFKGRVPIEVRDLPYGVQVRDVGLNGVLITEQQTSRRFVITAEPWVKPQSRPIFAVGRVESDPATEVASAPIVLTVAPAAARASR